MELSMNNNKPVWFITGCSSGFGYAIARKAASLGFHVVATARDPEKMVFSESESESIVKLPLDVTKDDQVAATVDDVLYRFGKVDVLVNNAGIGYISSIEESQLADVRRVFDVNFWGVASLTKKILPAMRKQKSGFIVNMSSIAGIRGAAGLGYYNATKFAIEGFSEALAQEVAEFNIRVMLVEPGSFRTNWLERSAVHDGDSNYDLTVGFRKKKLDLARGRQPGDPQKAAAAIISAVQSEDPPMRLLLGKKALASAREKVDELRQNFEKYSSISESVDFPVFYRR
jgi:NAD(P)-dependent dehydrogenase (short-subunit alcohol dehydrogenase family)